MTTEISTEKAMREIIDRQEIRDVLATFARGIDRSDVEMVRSTFWEDGRFDHGRLAQGPIEGFLKQMPTWPFVWTQHHLAQTMYEFQGADLAFTETYCMAYHRRRADEYGVEKDITIGVRYLDRFERRDGAWKIAHRVLGWDWNRMDPVVEKSDPGPEMVQGSRDRTDMAYHLSDL
jgi:hypothetical protein